MVFIISIIIIVCILFLLFLITTRYYSSMHTKNKTQDKTQNTTISISKSSDVIYCVMVTGKDDRWNFAQISIKNFKQQDYQKKKLIIINEGKKLNVNDPDILEISITNRKQKKMTLGDMRNLAFEFIPEGALWTLWDDDDWRSNNYLTYLYNRLGNNDYLFFTKRIEHNLNTNFTWIMELKSGFVIMFGRKNWELKYDSTEYNEDIPLKQDVKAKTKYIIIDNDPKIYVRMVHKTNTSVIANKGKDSLRDTKKNKSYFEYKATQDIVDYVKNVTSENYNILE